MTTKRPSLFGSLKAVAPFSETSPVNSVADMQTQIAARLEPPAEPPKSASRRYPVASTRQGKRVTGVYLSDEALAQLKIIAARERKTLQELMQEAVNGVFEARGLSRIA